MFQYLISTINCFSVLLFRLILFILHFRNSQNSQDFLLWPRVEWQIGPKQNQILPVGPVLVRLMTNRVAPTWCVWRRYWEILFAQKRDLTHYSVIVSTSQKWDFISLNLEGPLTCSLFLLWFKCSYSWNELLFVCYFINIDNSYPVEMNWEPFETKTF